MDLVVPIEQKFNETFSGKYSTDILNNITIIFICMDKCTMDQGFYKERHYISWKKKYADIRLALSYEQFVKADEITKKKMIWEVIDRALDYLKIKKALTCVEGLTDDLRQVYWMTDSNG